MTELAPVIDGNPVETKTEGMIRGSVIAIPLEMDKPVITWHGSKLSTKLYNHTVAFAKHCNDKYGGEVQGRLFYSASRDEWKVCVLPQYISRSLESKEIPEHKDRKRILEEFDGDWKQDGTWHSHAGASAFQSGTDVRDEMNQTGLHYTVGLMENKNAPADIHVRYMFRTHFYEMTPDELIEDCTTIIDQCLEFPADWLKMLHEKPKSTVHSYGGFDGHRKFTPPNRSFEGAGMYDDWPTSLTDDDEDDGFNWTDELMDAFNEKEGCVTAFLALLSDITGCDDLTDGIEVLTDAVNDILLEQDAPCPQEDCGTSAYIDKSGQFFNY